jgi:hypothetical protein
MAIPWAGPILAGAFSPEFILVGLNGNPPEQGFASTAARSRVRESCEGMTEQVLSGLAHFAPDEEGALPCLFERRDLRTTIFPVGLSGELGVIAVSSAEPGFPDELDRAIAGTCAAQAAAALQGYRVEESAARR